MRRLTRILLTTVVCLGLGAGCGGGGTNKDMGGGNNDGGPGGGDMAGGGGNVDDACAGYATAYCTKLASCTMYNLQVTYGDMATCVTRSKLLCTLRGKAPGTGASASSITSCGAAYAGAKCEDLFNPGAVTACRPVAGSLADGLACGDSGQCKNGYCNLKSGTLCGTCVKPAAVDQACNASTPCDLGLYCAVATGKCAKIGDVNDACGIGSLCKYGLYCKSGKCAPQLKLNDTCDPNDPLAANACSNLQGLYCDFTMKKCLAYGLAKPGDACGQVSGVTTLCTAGSQCRMPPNLKCQPPAKDGEMCSILNGPGCLAPAACIDADKKCELPDPAVCK